MTTVVVLAAVIERDGHFLVTQRPEGTHLSGYWQFPGGKCEPGETHRACLARELMEELGVEATIGDEVLVTEHAYPERTVRLHFVRCSLLGAPHAMAGQQMRWVARSYLRSLKFPEADRELVDRLAGDATSPARS